MNSDKGGSSAKGTSGKGKAADKLKATTPRFAPNSRSPSLATPANALQPSTSKGAIPKQTDQLRVTPKFGQSTRPSSSRSTPQMHTSRGSTAIRCLVPSITDRSKKDLSVILQSRGDAVDGNNKRLPDSLLQTSVFLHNFYVKFDAISSSVAFAKTFLEQKYPHFFGTPSEKKENLILYAFGPSGTGKSTTFFGSSKVEGLLPHVFPNENVSVQILELRESDMVDLITDNKVLVNDEQMYPTPSTTGRDNMLGYLGKRMWETTPYNDHASRSGLAVIITSEDEKKKLVFVDLPGHEPKNTVTKDKKTKRVSVETTKIIDFIGSCAYGVILDKGMTKEPWSRFKRFAKHLKAKSCLLVHINPPFTKENVFCMSEFLKRLRGTRPPPRVVVEQANNQGIDEVDEPPAPVLPMPPTTDNRDDQIQKLQLQVARLKHVVRTQTTLLTQSAKEAARSEKELAELRAAQNQQAATPRIVPNFANDTGEEDFLAQLEDGSSSDENDEAPEEDHGNVEAAMPVAEKDSDEEDQEIPAEEERLPEISAEESDETEEEDGSGQRDSSESDEENDKTAEKSDENVEAKMLAPEETNDEDSDSEVPAEEERIREIPAEESDQEAEEEASTSQPRRNVPEEAVNGQSSDDDEASTSSDSAVAVPPPAKRKTRPQKKRARPKPNPKRPKQLKREPEYELEPMVKKANMAARNLEVAAIERDLGLDLRLDTVTVEVFRAPVVVNIIKKIKNVDLRIPWRKMVLKNKGGWGYACGYCSPDSFSHSHKSILIHVHAHYESVIKCPARGCELEVCSESGLVSHMVRKHGNKKRQ